MKNILEKTVEIENFINPENIQGNKDNGAAPLNTNIEPAVIIEVFNFDNIFNNSVGINDNSDNSNKLKQNNETNNIFNSLK